MCASTPPFLGGPSPSVASPAGLRQDCEDASFSPPWRRCWTVGAVTLQNLNEKSDWFHVPGCFLCVRDGLQALPSCLRACCSASLTPLSSLAGASPEAQSPSHAAPVFAPTPQHVRYMNAVEDLMSPSPEALLWCDGWRLHTLVKTCSHPECCVALRIQTLQSRYLKLIVRYTFLQM